MSTAFGVVALLTALAMTAPVAGAVTLEGARSKALEATKAERARGGVILFGLRAPVRAGASIRESGRRPPPTGASARTMRGVATLGRERAYFFYLDRGAHQFYEHAGRVVLVGARSGRVVRSRSLRFAPVIDGRLPVFLRSREGYELPRYRVFASEYAVGGSSARAAAAGLGAFGGEPARGLRSAASERLVATRLAAERSCIVVSAGTRSGDLAALGSASGSPVIPLLIFNPSSGLSLASFVASQAISRRGCRDILIAISGDGYRALSPPSTRTSLVTSGRRMTEYHVNSIALRSIAAGNPSVTFKFMLDAPNAGAYVDPLRSLSNVLLVATSSRAGQTSFRYLPRKRIGGDSTRNPLRMRSDSSFFTTQLFGAASFSASDAETLHAAAEVDAGRAPSFFAYMIARGFALSGPFDFTADLGATQGLWVRFPVTPPGPLNGPPVAVAQAVTTTEDTPKAIVLGASDPDGNPLTFTLGSGPAHGALSGTAPNLTYTPAPNYNGPDSFTFSVSDGFLISATVTVTITVTAVDDPPVTTASGTLAYTENDPATAIAPALTVTDVDSANLSGASVQITGGLRSGEDLLALPSQPGIAGAYDAATGTLTLSGTASVAAYQAALRAVTYENSSDAPDAGPRTVTIKARDAGGFGPAATRTITVAPVNDPPGIVTSTGPLSYTEADPPTPIDPSLVLTDPDSQITGATVQITGNLASGEDVLGLASPPAGIGAAYVAGTGTLTLTGTASVAAYQAALQAVTYRNTSSNPSTALRTVTFLASDASSTSVPQTRDIALNATDNAPDVENSAGSLAYTEDDPATAIDTTITVTDVDSANLTGATVQITGNYVQGEDVLAFTPAGGISADPFDAANGRLTLTGTASVAAYEAALEAVTYRNTSDDPSTAPRTVTYQARDAGGFGLADTHGIAIIAVDDPPVAVNDSATVAEDSGAVAVAVLPNDTDADAGPKSVASVTQPANGTVVITGGGTGLTYAPTANYCNAPPGTTLDTFTYTLTPGGSTATVSITVTCVDDPPIAVDDSATVGEDSGANAIAVLTNDTDIDGGPKSVASVTQPAGGAVVITGGGTAVSYTPNANYCNNPPGTAPDTFTYTLNGGSPATVSVTVNCGDDPPVAVDDSATVAEDSGANAVDVLGNDTDVDGGPKQVQSVTQPPNGAVVVVGGGTGVSYAPNANYCNGPPDTFTYTLNGGDVGSVAVTVTCSADPPVVNTVGPPLAYTENGGAFPIDGSVTVTDPDVGGTIASATVQITANYAGAQDVLALSNPLSHPLITPSFVGATLTLSGSASPAAYQAALRDVTYVNTSESPSTLMRTVTFTVTDDTALSGSDSRDIVVTAVDDDPVAVADAATVLEDAGATPVPVLINDTDVDGGPKAIVSATQPANGTVVILGGGTGLTYQPDANYCNDPPGNAPDTFTYTLTPGGSSTTVSMTVTCVSDAPVVVNTAAALTYTENDPATPVDPGVTVADPDAGASIASATVRFTSNYAGAQDVLALANPLSHPLVASSFVGDTLTLTGSASPAAYQAALRDVTYVNSSEAPSPLTRTVTFTATDTTALSGSDARDIQVLAVDDLPVAVNDSFTVLEDSGTTAPPVLANDTDLDGGSKVIASTTQPDDGVVVITGGGTGLTYQPDPNYCNDPPGTAPDTFTYTLAPGGSTATVSMTVTCVNDLPVADDETFSGAQAAVGNTAFVGDDPSDGPPTVAGPRKTITGDILDGDVDVDGPGPLVVTAGTFASNDGGVVVIESDGDFTFTPAAGTSCSDTSDFFDYTVSDQNTPTAGTDSGRVTINIANCVWYVHNNAPGNSGTSTAPFDTLAQAESASAAAHTIFVFDGDGTTTGYAAGIDLKPNQRLLGEATNLQVGSDVLHTGIPANRPTITDNNADVVALASNNTVRGIEINPQGTGGAIAGGSGDASGTIDDVRIIDTGPAGTQPSLELATTTGTFDVSNLTIDNSAATGTTGGSIGVRLDDAGTVNFASAGTISITTAGAKGLDATGPTTSLGAGSVFDAITVTGSGSGAVNMLNTTGTTTFSNLALTTTSGANGAFVLNNAGNITVSNAGTANVSSNGGPAVLVSSTANPTLDFDDVSVVSSVAGGIFLDGIGAGTFSASSGTLAGVASGVGSSAFRVNGGSGAISYAGAIADGTGASVLIQSRTGGTVTLSGTITDGPDVNGGPAVTGSSGGSTVFSGPAKTFSTGAGAAVQLVANTGHTISFTNGGLDVDTTSGTGFVAQAGGTVNVTGAGNTIDTGTGSALLVDNTNIGASHATFERVSTNGAVVGIRANATGTAGRLIVTGTGGTCTSANTSGCSGGQLANLTGADDSTTTPSGTGIVLNDTLNPSFTRMWIHDASNYGIRGTSVSGFTLANSVINGANGTNGTTPFDDSSVSFSNLTGSAAVSDTHVSGGFEDNFRVTNSSGSLNRITFTSITMGAGGTRPSNDAMLLETGPGAGQLHATVTGSTFSSAAGDLLQLNHGGTGTGDLVLTGNAFSNSHPAIATGGGGLSLFQSGVAGGSTTMNISGNSFRDAVGQAVLAVKSIGPATQAGTFTNNFVGVASPINSGSASGSGLALQLVDQGSINWTVTNNTIRGYNNFGIEVLAGGGGSPQSGTINTTITGNTILQPGNTAGTITIPKQGIHYNIGTVPGDTFQACARITGNTIDASGADGVPATGVNVDVRLRQRQNTTIRLPGYAGANNDNAAVQNFVNANNSAGTSTLAQNTVGSGGGGFTGTGATCP